MAAGGGVAAGGGTAAGGGVAPGGGVEASAGGLGTADKADGATEDKPGV